MDTNDDEKFMSNLHSIQPLYFKSFLVNVVHCTIASVAALILFYNLMTKSSRFQAGITNRMSYYSLLLLFIPILLDSVFDIVTDYKPEHFQNITMGMYMGTMVLFTMFIAFYCISYAKIYSMCNGYSPLNNPKISDDEIVPPYENEDEERSDKNTSRKSLYLSRFLNVYLYINVIWSLLTSSLLLTLTYGMRLWTFNDDSLKLELDLSVWSCIAIALHVPIVVYDFFFFDCYTGPIILHYLTSAAIGFGMMMNFYNMTLAAEKVTLILVMICIVLTVIKFIAFNERGPKHMLSMNKRTKRH